MDGDNDLAAVLLRQNSYQAGELGDVNILHLLHRVVEDKAWHQRLNR
ncbi:MULTISPECIES: hypothetical protein [unclassified Rhodococcus (in: high G+C Gram-positive bacteria)]|nr:MULTISPECIES: hypothetical protein [unclassified Rhodococcus (in: high G+C Gram-positive bacteria)]MDI9924408.1 hypothetical protein [Rhodococcus sp. IEGM 1341]